MRECESKKEGRGREGENGKYKGKLYVNKEKS
jgi:hypothetical protein